AAVARLSSLADETPEGRSIVALCAEKHGLPTKSVSAELGAAFVPFSAQTRMSGMNLNGLVVRKGAASAIAAWVRERGGTVPDQVTEIVDRISADGGTPLVCAVQANGSAQVRGVIRLSDVVKPGMRERFDELRE